MTAMFALVNVVLGFVPFVAIALVITTVLWAATKLFPEFGAMVSAVFDGLFGVDANYDEIHATGYNR